MRRLRRERVDGGQGQERRNVANGDMVTLALIQGVLNTFVIVLSRVVGYFVDRVLLKNDRDSVGIGFFVSTIVAQIVLGILASMIVMWFSRRREFRADAGGAKLAGRGKMIAALERLNEFPEAPFQRVKQHATSAPSGLAPFGENAAGKAAVSRL